MQIRRDGRLIETLNDFIQKPVTYEALGDFCGNAAVRR